MLMSLETNVPELSFLLHKHPGRVHTQDSSFGKVHVFYPHPQKAVLFMEIDPLKLTRRGGSSNFALQPYVNDRAYVASSFLSVACNQMFRTAMGARCESHPELVSQPLDLRIGLPLLPCRGGEALLRRLFEPLGYTLEVQGLALDERFPEWGDSSYFDVTLAARIEVFRALRHLYILMPVLDNDKHYWVGKDEVEKLLERGQDWLAEHPERDLIVSRYLRFQRDLSQRALSQLAPLTDEPEKEEDNGEVEAAVEHRIGLHDQRLDAVAALLDAQEIRTVADLGCGEGKLLGRLLKNSKLTRILACDVSTVALDRAALSLERVHENKRAKVELFQSSLLYADYRLTDLDAVVLVEVLEHIDLDRLPRVAHNLFVRARPKTVVITTPNSEYNAVWESLSAGRFRHSDHRFEWTRQQFQQWTETVKGDYNVEVSGLGDEHESLGCPSQMAVFRR
jgi:3' terminal RNA ribose 2'-O-methyltransferase Hen1